jgi:hypothetical protein
VKGRVGSTNHFRCPSEPDQDCSYGFNQKLDGRTVEETNPKTVLLFECDAGWNATGTGDTMVARNHLASRRNSRPGGREEIYHVTFVDGSFAAIPASGLPVLRWDP